MSGLAQRYPFELNDDDFLQPRALFSKVMSDTDRAHLVGNIVAHLGNAQKRIQLRQASLFYKVHEEYGQRVAEGIGLDLNEVKRLAGLAQPDRVKATS